MRRSMKAADERTMFIPCSSARDLSGAAASQGMGGDPGRIDQVRPMLLLLRRPALERLCA